MIICIIIFILYKNLHLLQSMYQSQTRNKIQGLLTDKTIIPEFIVIEIFYKRYYPACISRSHVTFTVVCINLF